MERLANAIKQTITPAVWLLTCPSLSQACPRGLWDRELILFTSVIATKVPFLPHFRKTFSARPKPPQSVARIARCCISVYLFQETASFAGSPLLKGYSPLRYDLTK